MNLLILKSGPDSGCKFRSVSDEPSVCVIVGSTGLAGHLSCEGKAASEGISCSGVDYTLHKVRHEVCSLLADGLAFLCREFSKDISLVILDSCHKQWSYVYTFGREGIIGSHHLKQ